MVTWDSNIKASRWWYLAGFSLIGALVATIYVLLSKSQKKTLSLLYLVGFIGPIIVYAIVKGKDNKLADLSIKLFIGEIIIFIIMIFSNSVLLGIFNYQSLNSINVNGTCIANKGFECNVVNASNNNLTILFSQATGSNWNGKVILYISESGSQVYNGCSVGSCISKVISENGLQSGEQQYISFNNVSTLNTQNGYVSSELFVDYGSTYLPIGMLTFKG